MDMNRDIGWAVERMKKGYQIRRHGWNGKGMYIALQEVDEHSKMQQSYVYISPVDGKLIPWLCSQQDLLAEDWEYID